MGENKNPAYGTKQIHAVFGLRFVSLNIIGTI
jgi:hypothetical protein